jgi:starch synthase
VLEILIVAPEIAPITKIGGIADGVAGLSKALRRLGHAVTVALPRCRAAERIALEVERREPIELRDAPPGGERATIEVGAVHLDSGVEVILFEIPGVPAELGPHGDDIDGNVDNARRFGLFARAVVELAHRRARGGAPYDVIHAHEWPTALVPYLARQRRAELGGPRLVFTIHTLAFQGIFPRRAMVHLGLGAEHDRPDRLEFHGRLNLMKAGILGADVVTAVSVTYAREIQTPMRGEMLDGVLRARGDGVVGIVNGIDADLWNPARDPALPASYGPDAPEGKAACKAALLRELGLDGAEGRPLVVSVGRVFDQKGSDFLIEALPALVSAGASVAIAGTGDPTLVAALVAAAAPFPGRVVYVGFAPEDLVHRMVAGGDLLVMPSRFEPCGLVQLYAQRYGAVPVAHRTGGLADTIVDAGADLASGTGFLYNGPLSPQDLAVSVFEIGEQDRPLRT